MLLFQSALSVSVNILYSQMLTRMHGNVEHVFVFIQIKQHTLRTIGCCINVFELHDKAEKGLTFRYIANEVNCFNYV